MKVQVTKQMRIILAGSLIGTIVGALIALILSKQKRLKAAKAGRMQASVLSQEEELPLGQLAALVWHAIGIIRQIADFGRENPE